MTTLTKPVTRRDKFPHDYHGRPLVVTIHPGVNDQPGSIELREAGRRRSVSVNLSSVWQFAWERHVATQNAKISNLTRSIMKSHGVNKREAKKLARQQLGL